METGDKRTGGGTRPMAPGVAGGFYPADPSLLRRAVDTLLREADSPPLEGTLKALMVPHAGYMYSGPVAAKGYRYLRDLDKKKNWRVIIIGPSHSVPFNGVSVGLYDRYATPLGEIPVSSAAWKFLDSGAIFMPKAHEAEHSIEVQLPFLRHALKNFEIIPLLTSASEHDKLADIIEPFLDDDTLLIISSDLSHEKPYDKARQMDTELLNWIVSGDEHSIIKRGEACGPVGILAMIELSKRLSWKRILVDYATSGDTYGSKSRVVGYGCVVCVD